MEMRGLVVCMVTEFSWIGGCGVTMRVLLLSVCALVTLDIQAKCGRDRQRESARARMCQRECA
eukprot:3784133-Rhodomonas_salina.3